MGSKWGMFWAFAGVLICSERSLKRYLSSVGLRRNLGVDHIPTAVIVEVESQYWSSHSDSAIQRYVELRHQYRLSSNLFLKPGLIDRLNQVEHIRKTLGLTRKQEIEQHDLDRLVQLRKRHIAYTMGYRRLTYHLRNDLKVWVTRSAVYHSLTVVDREGLDRRSRGRLTRRLFRADGPDQVWAYDGFDKLARWGFPIHGCVDVYSRYLLWLRVGISNRDPRWPLAYYLDAIDEQARLNPNGEGNRLYCYC